MTVTIAEQLDPAVAREVLALVGATTERDGVSPVSEHVLLHLRHGGNLQAMDLLARGTDGELVGYAHLDTSDRTSGPSAELAVHPDHRRRGVATALLDALEQASDRSELAGAAGGAAGRLRLWAHGHRPGAAELARSRGYARQRALWRMRRSLLSELPTAPLPPGVRLRTFEVGRDEAAWTELNNRAFVDHPEQGGWSVDQVRTREKEPWFDPAGFLLAQREADAALVGFHWTKVHGGPDSPHADQPIGEVYVLGVDPEVHGGGLGAALTVAGLRHLRSRGLSEVMLYVDEANAPAIRVYTRLGFTRWDVDVQYSRVVS